MFSKGFYYVRLLLIFHFIIIWESSGWLFDYEAALTFWCIHNISGYRPIFTLRLCRIYFQTWNDSLQRFRFKGTRPCFFIISFLQTDYIWNEPSVRSCLHEHQKRPSFQNLDFGPNEISHANMIRVNVYNLCVNIAL